MELLDAKDNSRPTVNNAPYTLPVILAQIEAAAPGAPAANQATLANVVSGMFNNVGRAVPQNAPKFNSNFTYAHAFAFPGGHLTAMLDWIYKTKYWSSGQAGGLDTTAALANTTNLAWQPARPRGRLVLHSAENSNDSVTQR